MPDPSAVLTADKPWRGAEPYTEEDRAFFFGRRREIEELRHLLQRDTLTVLIGTAGTGKTSLVRAGLLPSLSPDWLPVLIKIDWAAANAQRPLSRQVLEAIDAAALAHPLVGPESKPADTLWEALHRTGARWWNARQRVVTPVIVLDQLEDAFVTGATDATTRRHRDRFLEELSQLVANRPPSRVASRIEDGSEPEDAFDFGPVPVRIVFIVREEATAMLAALRALFPTLGRSELRLTAFTEAQARDVLIRASAQRGLFADGIIDQLLPRLSAGNDREHPFAPGTLSVQARELAELRSQRNSAQITADFFTPAQPAQPAPTPAASENSQPADTSEVPARGMPAWLRVAAILTVCAGAALWWQQQQRSRSSLPATVVVTEPAKPSSVVEPALDSPPPTPAEPRPRIALTFDAPSASPTTPIPETPTPATPLPTPPPAPPPVLTPTPTPLPATPIPAPEMITPAPHPSPTPVPPTPPGIQEPPSGTTTILPPTPAPSPVAEPSTPRPEASRPPVDAPRPRANRPNREQPRRPATSAIITPAPSRATPVKKKSFLPVGGN